MDVVTHTYTDVDVVHRVTATNLDCSDVVRGGMKCHGMVVISRVVVCRTMYGSGMQWWYVAVCSRVWWYVVVCGDMQW